MGPGTPPDLCLRLHNTIIRLKNTKTHGNIIKLTLNKVVVIVVKTGHNTETLEFTYDTAFKQIEDRHCSTLNSK